MILPKLRRITLFSLAFVASYVTMATAQHSIPELFEASFEAETNGDYPSALNKVLEIVRSDMKNYTAILRSGWLFYNNKKYKSSLKYYQKAHKLKPRAIEPLLGMSLQHMALEEWEHTEIVIKEILDKDPNNYLANSRLAFILYSQGKYGEARTLYSKILQLYPADIEMMLGIAWTYVKMGYKKKASTWFNKVLQVRQTNVNALAGMDAVR